MNMPASIFEVVVLKPQGYEVPCTKDAPIFGQAQATLNPDDMFAIVQRRYNHTWHDGSWQRLDELSCPTVTQCRTRSIRNVCQEGVDPSGQPFCHSLGDYVKLFMRHLSPLAYDDIPEVAYCQLFIIGLTSALRT